MNQHCAKCKEINTIFAEVDEAIDDLRRSSASCEEVIQAVAGIQALLREAQGLFQAHSIMALETAESVALAKIEEERTRVIKSRQLTNEVIQSIVERLGA